MAVDDEINKRKNTLLDKLLSWGILWVSLPVTLSISFWRARRFRNTIFGFILISLGVVSRVGAESYFSFMGSMLQVVMGFAFMILQFAGLFWFLSKTKVIESVPGEKGLISFDDYYGSEHLVKIVRQWVSLLTDRSKLDEMGGRAISGILMEGPPGVGKTMLARALSTDANAAFIGMSGSDFTSMFFGIGTLKVRSMFAKARVWARDYGSCILFIDEIDAIAANRGGVSGDPTKGPMQGGMAGGIMGGMGSMGILSRLLVEMDGITEIPLRSKVQNTMRTWVGVAPIDPGVVLVMGSTNRKGVLDPAIVRSGRFDRTVTVTMPDKGSRRAVFHGYLKKVKHEKDIDVDVLVRVTPGVSQADIASAVTKDAARLAIFDGRASISQIDILKSLQELKTGVPQPISEFEPRQRMQVAVHEAGHAVAAYHLMREYAHIGWVSIVRRGGILGYVSFEPKEDTHTFPLSRLRKGIIVALAGHEAVKLIMGEPWTGASGDLNSVRSMLASLIGHLEFGTLPTSMNIFDSVERVGPNRDNRLDGYIKASTDETTKLLTIHRAELEALVEALLEKDELTGQEAIAIIEGAIDAE